MPLPSPHPTPLGPETTRAGFLRRSAGLGLAAALGTLATAPRAHAGALAARFPAWRTIDVRSYGAAADGITDDSGAILAAVAAMGPRSVLFFGPGTYRFARRWPAGDAAIAVTALSEIGIEMAPGAVLLMDNLDGSGSGTSHGILVRGACSDVHLLGCTVRWKTLPARRGFGDAFRFLGYPSDVAPPPGWTASSGPVERISLSACSAEGAPQTGAVFMGCADVGVRGFCATDTRADGLHVNACRDVTVERYTALRPGDDGLAWVTYHHLFEAWLGAEGPFNQTSLGRWSNSGCVARGVVVRSGAANGIRIAGAAGVSVEEATVTDARAGIIVDSGRVGPSNRWQYLASRDCAVRDVTIEGCQVGVLAQVFNASSGDDPAWWRADISFSEVTITGSSRYSIRTEGGGFGNGVIAGLHFSGVKVAAVESEAKVSMSSLRDSSVTDLDVAGTSIAFFGRDTPLVGRMDDLVPNDLVVGRIAANGGGISFQDVRGVTVREIRSVDAPYTGLNLTRVRDITIRAASVLSPNRRNDGLARGVLIAKGQGVTISAIDVGLDANDQAVWRSLEIGGGDATDISSDVRLPAVRYSRLLDRACSDVVVQGGQYAPVRSSYRMSFRNGGSLAAYEVEEWSTSRPAGEAPAVPAPRRAAPRRRRRRPRRPTRRRLRQLRRMRARKARRRRRALT